MISTIVNKFTAWFIVCLLLVVGCGQTEREEPWYRGIVELDHTIAKVTLITEIAHSLEDMGLSPRFRKSVGLAMGRETIFLVFLNQDKRLAVLVHDISGEDRLEINIFLSGLPSEATAGKIVNVIRGVTNRHGAEIAEL